MTICVKYVVMLGNWLVTNVFNCQQNEQLLNQWWKNVSLLTIVTVSTWECKNILRALACLTLAFCPYSLCPVLNFHSVNNPNSLSLVSLSWLLVLHSRCFGSGSLSSRSPSFFLLIFFLCACFHLQMCGWCYWFVPLLVCLCKLSSFMMVENTKWRVCCRTWNSPFMHVANPSFYYSDCL